MRITAQTSCAVAPLRIERVRVPTQAILARVEGVLQVVRVLSVRVRHDHLREGEPPCHGAALQAHRVQHGALSRAEAHHQLPALPAQQPTCLGLGLGLGLGLTLTLTSPAS